MSKVRTRTGIENGRAAYAFGEVKRIVESGNHNNKKYRSYVKKIPSLIQVNGLGQTLAFCFQKKKEYLAIYQQIHRWLKETHGEYFIDESKELVEVVVSLKSSEYRMLTMETIALLNWMRKFADGMINE
ncbi:type III-B CRISPR module-associated protein Cmr5 [Bacillus sp. DTU_2020_1000418_1_SI_GHA_SEK_038]|uniref:type III-B CRISPR module-associated protein Cmr5 n=1 Tax=Bacillus sp. DTU_2020_1000418_1_SI_GHA_SEK_038 TaxID=3077585 RepID=UPI0028EB8D26|nr:type III-B CRISPR module-associated protein Cmr5 [Bacillus sp. DTU_2020_1000418_1_SI_GHA_SEK_038]WNS77426.1 type III-B CRISPR module-associated protein Cmr5 [Bacillus sp. DTU_2020_1000418_1_SI_GHA_SEK_038]